MHERQVKKRTPFETPNHVETPPDRLRRDDARKGIASVSACVLAKNVPGKLIEDEDKGERAVGAPPPMAEQTRRRRLMMRVKTPADFRIEFWAAAKPFLLAGLGKPEADDFGGRARRAFDELR
jgi:hypothetical protein